MFQAATTPVTTALDTFVRTIVDAIPNLLVGLLFVVLAYVAIKLIQYVLRRALERIYPADQQLIVDVAVLVVGLFLWFGAGLTLLSIVGLGELAASLGTAVGFIALGISYALSNMIADTVAGVYLLRDPDFNDGYTVTTDSTTGTVVDIGLRKSRLELDNGDVVVIANRDVEKRWVRKGETDAVPSSE